MQSWDGNLNHLAIKIPFQTISNQTKDFFFFLQKERRRQQPTCHEEGAHLYERARRGTGSSACPHPHHLKIGVVLLVIPADLEPFSPPPAVTAHLSPATRSQQLPNPSLGARDDDNCQPKSPLSPSSSFQALSAPRAKHTLGTSRVSSPARAPSKATLLPANPGLSMKPTHQKKHFHGWQST